MSDLSNFTNRERAAEIIDSLLVLFTIYDKDIYESNSSAIKDAIEYIAKTRRQNSDYPITVSLARYMREKGLIE